VMASFVPLLPSDNMFLAVVLISSSFLVSPALTSLMDTFRKIEAKVPLSMKAQMYPGMMKENPIAKYKMLKYL